MCFTLYYVLFSKLSKGKYKDGRTKLIVLAGKENITNDGDDDNGDNGDNSDDDGDEDGDIY